MDSISGRGDSGRYGRRWRWGRNGLHVGVRQYRRGVGVGLPRVRIHGNNSEGASSEWRIRVGLIRITGWSDYIGATNIRRRHSESLLLIRVGLLRETLLLLVLFGLVIITTERC